MNDLKFSLFHSDKGLKDCKPKQEINFDRLIEVYNSSYVKQKSLEILAETDKDKKAIIKRSLPYFSAYGVFKYKNNEPENLEHFNNNMIAIDIDGLENSKTTFEVFDIIKRQFGVYYATISPRGLGVKALVRTSIHCQPLELYDLLKHNKKLIASCLGIEYLVDNLDERQFVLSQAFFINYSEYNFINKDPIPLIINVEPIPIIEVNIVDTTRVLPLNNNRVEKYLNSILNGIISNLALTTKGNRHASIMKINGIADFIHYAPNLESEYKSILLDSCVQMYGGVNGAKSNNVYSSFSNAWNKKQNKEHSTIETILKEIKWTTVKGRAKDRHAFTVTDLKETTL